MTSSTEQAFAVLRGGGAKGIALAGALDSARKVGYEFAGYAGTSAGSIVALLSAVGYTPLEIKDLLLSTELEPLLLGDAAPFVRSVRTAAGLKLWLLVGKHGKMCWRMRTKLGLSEPVKFWNFLHECMSEKVPPLRYLPDPTFNDLKKQGLPQLKVVASHLGRRAAQVYDSNTSGDQSVLNAIRASMSYPLVFRPVADGNRSYLVDGGLVANLPVFLFEKEREGTGLPVIAFDLVSQAPKWDGKKYTLIRYCADMIATVMDGSSQVQKEYLATAYHHVQIDTGKTSTLDLGISQDDRGRLFDKGAADAREYFDRHGFVANQHLRREEAIKRSRAPDDLVQPVLNWFRRHIGDRTRARDVRVFVMLPSGDNLHFEVVYKVNMDRDSDSDLRLPFDAGGFMGMAWQLGVPVLGSWATARRSPAETPISATDLRFIKHDREAVIAAPIYHPSRRSPPRPGAREIQGVVVADAANGIRESGWAPLRDRWVEEEMRRLADIIGKLIH